MNRDVQLEALKSQVGFEEGWENDNPFGPWQGVSNSAWCDSFAQWGAVENGGFRWSENCQFGWKGDAYCPYTRIHAEDAGLWRGPEETPQPGWQVLFSWDQSGVPDHIGTVLHDNGDGTFTAIEGNYHDRAAITIRDYTYVAGYVALPAEGGDGPSPPPPGPRPHRMLRRGYSGEDVRGLQERLGRLGYDMGPDGADGDFGMRTEDAVTGFQRDHTDTNGQPLEADGVVGELTWGAVEAAG